MSHVTATYAQTFPSSPSISVGSPQFDLINLHLIYLSSNVDRPHSSLLAHPSVWKYSIFRCITLAGGGISRSVLI